MGMPSDPGGLEWNALSIRSGPIEPRPIWINGYKHSMIQVIAAAIAADVPILIKNAPLVDDTFVLKGIIERCSGSVDIDQHRVLIRPGGISDPAVDPVASRAIHGSLYLIPALGVRLGEFVFGEAGGCRIGSAGDGGRRPFEHIFDVMSHFGIACTTTGGQHRGERRARVHSVTIDILRYSTQQDETHGPLISSATKAAILCSLSTRETTILNPYLKTDVLDLLRLLRDLGCDVEATGDRVHIRGGARRASGRPLEFTLSPCGSEIVTYIALSVHTGTSLELRVGDLEAVRQNLKPEFELLRQMNVDVEFDDGSMFVSGGAPVRSVDIEVTHRGIQSDHHPFFALMLLRGGGTARIREHVWKDRFSYVNELRKLGAVLAQEDNQVTVSPSQTSRGGQTLFAGDTRSVAVLTLAALGAEGSTVIEGAQHLRRGYEDLIPNLQAAGARIETFHREPEDAPRPPQSAP